ncbi:MAG TPA: hypothetical protein VEB64_09505 [Azospirillaceae bacterium]|nr:hypothetical protein [Azospirillaceae bacterium]
MAQQRQTTPHRDTPHPGSQAARLRADIDSGRTGDKIPAIDPAASPLGTDDEAAGQINPNLAPPHTPPTQAAPEIPPGRGAGFSVPASRGLMVALAAMVIVVGLFLAGLWLVMANG